MPKEIQPHPFPFGYLPENRETNGPSKCSPPENSHGVLYNMRRQRLWGVRENELYACFADDQKNGCLMVNQAGASIQDVCNDVEKWLVETQDKEGG
nr:uncharacterized protein LOC119172473 isoform X2 [Rhipicephalus microplus]